MSDNMIKIVPSDFETAYTGLESLKNSLDEYKSVLESSYSEMQANWFGNAADAFGERVQKLLVDYAALTNKMEVVAKDIKKVGDDMQTLDQRLADSM